MNSFFAQLVQVHRSAVPGIPLTPEGGCVKVESLVRDKGWGCTADSGRMLRTEVSDVDEMRMEKGPVGLEPASRSLASNVSRSPDSYA